MPPPIDPPWTPARHSRRRSWLWLHGGALGCAALLAGACSSRSTPPPTAGPSAAAPNLDMIVDTVSGSDVFISGRLSIVALETAEGSMTADLLPGDPAIRLVDPLGDVVLPALTPVPPGTYVAVHLLFGDQDAIGILPDRSQVKVRMSKRDFRAAFVKPLVLEQSAQSWFTLRHDGPVTLVRQGDVYGWAPDWTAEAAEVQLIRGGEIEVVDVDTTARQVDGLVLPAEAVPVVLEFAGTVEFRRAGEVVGADQFLATLRPGDVLAVDGWMDQWRHVQVVTVEADGDVNCELLTEVRAEIVQLVPDKSSFVVSVLDIRKNAAGLAPDRPHLLNIRVDGSTRVKWAPRAARGRNDLTFSALRLGMIVDVEWHGAAPDLTLTASRVDIQAVGRSDLIGLVPGEITEVRAAARQFVLTPLGEGGRQPDADRVADLVVTVDERSHLTRRTVSGHERIGIDALARGERVELLAERGEGDVVRALLVRAPAR